MRNLCVCDMCRPTKWARAQFVPCHRQTAAITCRSLNNAYTMCAATKKWYGREDLNLHELPHWNLNPARLPIPPRPHTRKRKLYRKQRILTALYLICNLLACLAHATGGYMRKILCNPQALFSLLLEVLLSILSKNTQYVE